MATEEASINYSNAVKSVNTGDIMTKRVAKGILTSIINASRENHGLSSEVKISPDTVRSRVKRGKFKHSVKQGTVTPLEGIRRLLGGAHLAAGQNACSSQQRTGSKTCKLIDIRNTYHGKGDQVEG